jgi:hypothetical protein
LRGVGWHGSNSDGSSGVLEYQQADFVRISMQRQRVISIAVLVLMLLSLVLVVADGLILPDVKHTPDSCPICALAKCLTTAQIASPVSLVESNDVHWLLPDIAASLWSEDSPQLFCARAPPLCTSI